ncbi:MAG: hypothetical protein WB402_10690 [Sulfuricaulis sp.]|uniref:hypothetical protein n=1 Tax=Sulfuricaulis sp. TaxID=2003553 RepID=UPI003C3843C7
MDIIRDMFGPGHSPLVSGAFFVLRILRFAVLAAFDTLSLPSVASRSAGRTSTGRLPFSCLAFAVETAQSCSWQFCVRTQQKKPQN